MQGETRNEVQLLLHVHKTMRAKQTGSTHQAINLNLVNPLSRHRRRSTGVCHGSQEPTPALSRTRAHNTQKLNVPSFQVSKFPNFQTFGSSFSHTESIAFAVPATAVLFLGIVRVRGASSHIGRCDFFTHIIACSNHAVDKGGEIIFN